MAGSITTGQAAAKAACLRHGITTLVHSDYASLANAVYTSGPVGDITRAARGYFHRNHRELDLTDEQVADIGQAVYTGIYSHY